MSLVLVCGPAVATATCTLRVGTSGDYAPFSLSAPADSIPRSLDPSIPSYEGLDIDLARRLGADLGCDVRFVPFAWPELDTRLASGAIDLVASGITMRPERAIRGRFSRPYAITGAMVLVRAGDAERFATVETLNQPGVRVAVNAGGHLERVARRLLPRTTIRPRRDNRALPRALRDGSVDAVMTDSAEARAWSGADLRAVGPLTHDDKALLLPAQAADLAWQVGDWLAAREADGWLTTLRERYLGAGGAMDAARAGREAVVGLIRLRLDLMPAVGAAKRHAGLPIEDKTQERRVLVRVAAQKPVHPARLANVYRELIAMAKAVQHAHPTDKPTATLDALRDAIARIDEQLVREVDRPHAASRAEWQAAIDQAITTAGVDAAMRARLAAALADF